MTRALFLAAFDSQLKWCSQIHDEFARRGFETRVIVPDVRSALSPQQIVAAGIDHVERASWSESVQQALDYDVVVCGLSGPLVKAFGFALADQLYACGGSAPILVTGWVGVIIEKIVAGYLDRCGSDVVIVNSTGDLELFRSAAQWLGLPPRTCCSPACRSSARHRSPHALVRYDVCSSLTSPQCQSAGSSGFTFTADFFAMPPGISIERWCSNHVTGLGRTPSIACGTIQRTCSHVKKDPRISASITRQSAKCCPALI